MTMTTDEVHAHCVVCGKCIAFSNRDTREVSVRDLEAHKHPGHPQSQYRADGTYKSNSEYESDIAKSSPAMKHCQGGR